MMGDILWKLYAKEQSDTIVKKYIYNESDNNNSPISLYADLDDQMINEVKKNKSIHYKSNSFVTGKEDVGNNNFKTHQTIGKEICDIALNQVRKQVESMDRLDQFIVTSALSGGTGSGFTSLLLERLSLKYNQKIEKNAFLIYPSQRMSNNIVDVYNAVLATNMTLEHCNSVVIFDNQSISAQILLIILTQIIQNHKLSSLTQVQEDIVKLTTINYFLGFVSIQDFIIQFHNMDLWHLLMIIQIRN
ncbi:unnamed protein product [Paramecium sonneborni]|uniref:Tubulin/FtsZ GTPase domain-containing protein n=1 Tax=Paramecium sonneborni TaxID=65129 RepID=A0A8S1QUY1_9CILI|nr:unnamed protein product [Paramecium sonneborni]